jgi:hypothetical protein
MNRHERRRAAKVFKGGVMTVTPAMAREMLRAGSRCAWNGCQAVCREKLPEGWRYLLMYWAPEPVINFTEIPPRSCDRDAVLCPEHARALDGLLVDLGRWMSERPQGTA